MSIAFTEHKASEPMLVASSALGETLTLDPKRAYEIWHRGKTAAGAAVASTLYVFTSQYVEDAVSLTGDYSEERGKIPLEPGERVLIGANNANITLMNAGDTMVSVIPSAQVGPNV